MPPQNIFLVVTGLYLPARPRLADATLCALSLLLHWAPLEPAFVLTSWPCKSNGPQSIQLDSSW